MTPFEELCAQEREGVEPSAADLERVGLRLGAAVGVAVATGTAASALGASAAVSSKWLHFAAAKTTLAWFLGAATGVGGVLAAVAFTQPGSLTGQSAGPVTTGPVTSAPSTQAGADQEPAPDAVELSPSDEIEGEVVAAPVEPRSFKEAPAVPSPRRAVARGEGETKAPPNKLQPVNRLSKDVALLSKVTRELNLGHAHQVLSMLSAADLKNSPLSGEFMAVRAVALCSTGQKASGSRLLTRLKKGSESSPALLRIEKACGK